MADQQHRQTAAAGTSADEQNRGFRGLRLDLRIGQRGSASLLTVLVALGANLLVAVAKAGPVRRIDLGKRLRLDPSTLTRNLQLILKQGWIEERPDEADQRSARLKITPKGRKLLESIAPGWKRAQARARQMLGNEGAALVLGLKERE